MELRIDARGLACPKPVIETKKAIESVSEGNIITVVDNAVARDNVSKLAKSMHLHYSVTETPQGYEISIFKGAYAETPVQKRPDLSQTVIVLGNSVIGGGDEALGDVLMKSYLYSLTECEPYPKTIVMLNKGVLLATTHTQAIELLKTLEDYGTEILLCGTCLDYYQLKDMVAVGDITNMYTIVEKMNEAHHTVVWG